jgi:hypothetical protein
MDPEEELLEVEMDMQKAVEHLLNEFSSVRTGKASPALIENMDVYVRAYDSVMKLKAVAVVTTPEPRMLMVADDADVLFPIIQALVSLVYPFKWRNTLIPNLPATWIMELDAPYPFFLGITRPGLPRGRVPTENVCQVDATHKTISLPPKVAAVEDSEAGRCLAQLISETFTVFEADVRKCVADG